jgi:pimeloyl-ACP methyl ester carboxylesterase
MVGMGVVRAVRRDARGGSILGGPALLVAALAASGAAYQSIAAARDGRLHPPPGRLMDVGGHRLHLHATGSAGDGGARGPTVGLESGVAATSAGWAWVQREVEGFAGVVFYDRAGIGWSEEGAQAPDALDAARQLRDALVGAGVPGPYVLVGHSLGGEYARVFAGLYPEEVAGMVLLDAGAPDRDGVMRGGAAAAPSSPGVPVPEGTMGQVERAFRLFRYAPLAARLGVARIALALSGTTGPLPPEQRAAAGASMSSPRHWGSSHD